MTKHRKGSQVSRGMMSRQTGEEESYTNRQFGDISFPDRDSLVQLGIVREERRLGKWEMLLSIELGEGWNLGRRGGVVVIVGRGGG